MSQRKTLNDVAKRAGVGKVTVSYVLNGRAEEARISPQTSERILAAARDLDYRPNALARMLLRKRTDSIAVVFQYADYFRSSSSFIGEVMRGVCDGCVEAGVDLMLHTKSASDLMAEADALTDGRVDGALVLRDAHDEMMELLLHRKFPVVLFFSRSDDPNVPFVDLDNFMGGKMATNHLIDLGHKRIAMMKGPLLSVSSNDRHSGYRSALEAAGIEYDAEIVLPATPDYHSQALMAMMRRPNRPTAVFVWSDDDAFVCMKVLSAMGLQVPDDVSVVGFDSSVACERVTPGLTSVCQPINQMARRATELLLEVVNGEGFAGPHQIVFPPRLDIRGSTSHSSDSG